MIDTPRISLLASVALAAGLVVGCVGPSERPPTRRAAGPIADIIQGPATLSLAGVVRDEQGRPIPAVWIEVEGFPETLKSPPPWRTDVHGRFQTDDVPEGPATLLVWTGARPGSTPTKVVKTTAGVRDLVIVLDPGPQLFLRLVGYVHGEHERSARVTWAEPDGSRRVRFAPIRADGLARFVALPPDREFELWAEAESNRRYVRARGLRPGQNEQRIERHEVKDIAGRIRGSEARLEERVEEAVGPLRDRLEVSVYAAPPGVFGYLPVVRTRVRQDGSFRIHGLPPGTYLVDVGTHAGEIFSVSKFVEAGTTDAIFSFD